MNINSISHSITARVAAGAVGVAMAISLLGVAAPASASSLTSAQVQAIVSLLQSFGASASTIANVQAALTGTATVSTGGSTAAAVCPYTWTRNLQVGSTGADVMKLQQALNAWGFTVAASGAGSAGMETSHFGPATKTAVVSFQNHYAAQVLTPVGLTAGTGYVGAATRAELNALCSGSSSSSSGTGSTVSTGPGITVSAATQPANTVTPENAARVPFTNFTITNNTSAAVTVNNVTVQRTGIGADTDFAGVVLLDSNGLQIGNAAVFNANHQASIGTTGFTVAAGASATFTVAGNIAAAVGAGNVDSVEVVAVNTSVPVAGTLPIVGASQTMNGSLSIGTATLSTSSYDPNSSVSKPIGTTAYRFTGFRVTAGSAEDLTLKSVRWDQSGSAGEGDISNVSTYVNGTAYPTVVDATGKYYTSTFGNGIVIPKGQSVDVYVQGDVTGTSAAGRTVEFDVYKNTDVYLVGNTYGYGITLSATGAGSASLSTDQTNHTTDLDTGTNPYILGSQLSITAGSVSTIQNSNNVPAQNIAVNVPNQPLGGFQTTILGEALTVQSLVIHANYAAGTAASTNLLQNVSLVDQNGSVVAGPVNGVNVGSSEQKLTFTGSITIPVGTDTFTLKGQVPSTVANNTTIQASTTPSSDWTNITGQTTGNNISLSTMGLLVMNQMTVKSATTTIAMASTPTSQTIVSGGTNVTLANVQIDASQSGEDVRLSSLPLTLTTGGSSPATNNLSGCQLYNGSTSLTTGSNVINPSGSSPADEVFTFDNSLTVPKGTVTTLALECNITSGATGTYQWSLDADAFSSGLVSGVTSGNSVTPSAGTVNGPTMTLAGTGTVAVTTDPSSPSLSLVAGGTTGVTVGAYNLQTTNEGVNLQQMALKLTNGSASDIGTVTIWNGSTQVGSLTFTGSASVATSTLSTPVTLPANAQTTLTIKANMGTVGTNQPATDGDLVQIDLQDAQGYGASSGKSIYTTGTSAVAGVRVVKTFPTLAAGSAGPVNPNGSNVVLKNFSITANSSGPVGIGQMKFNVATSSVNSLTNIIITGYTGGYNGTPISGQNSGGQLTGVTYNGGTQVITAALTSPVEISAGSTDYFTVTGNVAPTSNATTDSVFVTLVGDSSFTSPTTIAGLSSNFAWSDNATTTADIHSSDWMNSASVVGLPSTGL